MFYQLKDRYLLRGWQKLPWAIVDTQTGAAAFLDQDGFEAARLATGYVDVDLPFVSPGVQKAAQRLAEQGLVDKTAKAASHSLVPKQRYRLYDNRYIQSVHWSITGRCNYRCKHCYMSAPEAKYGELELKKCLKIVDELAACGVFSVSLTGGEPLVRSDFFEIVDALLSHGILITQIYSNGRLVTPQLLDELERRGIHPEFNMSFDGVGWHDWMRGVPGAQKAVERAFKLCQERGFPTGAEMAIHEGSAATLRESVQKLGAWGVSHLKTNPVSAVGEWEKNRLGLPISLQEMNQVYVDYIPAYYEDGMPLQTLNLGGFFMVNKNAPERFWVGAAKNCSDPASQVICQSARLHAYIGADGTLLPCMPLSAHEEIQKDFPNVVEQGLKACLGDSYYMRAITYSVSDYLAQNPECARCEYLSQCAGGCRAHALEANPAYYLGKDPVICNFYTGGWQERVNNVASQAATRYLRKSQAHSSKKPTRA